MSTDAQLLWGCVADLGTTGNLTAEAEIVASSTLLLQFPSHSCNEARGCDFMFCAELHQGNSRVLSKLLMNSCLSEGVKCEVTEA